MFLKQSTAVDVMLGPFVDSTDGSTTEEALTISQADLQLSKNGGAAAQKNDATAATHRYGGNYMVDLDATDTNTVGHLRLMCKESGALPVMRDFMVVPANVYDSLVGGTDTLNADVTQWLGQAVTADSNVPEVHVVGLDADVITEAKIADNAIAAEHIAANAIGASELATDCISSDQLAAAALAEIKSEVDSALSDIGLNHLLAASVTGTDVTDNSIIAKLVSASATADWDDFVNTDDSLQAIRDRGDAAWAGSPPTIMQSTTIATLASQTSWTLTAGSSDDNAYNDAYALVVDQVTGAQQCICDISDYTGATRTVTLASDPGIFTMATGDTVYIIAAPPGTTPPTAAAIADAVLQESVDDHSGTANSLAEHIDAIQVDAAAIEVDTQDLQTQIGTAGAGLTDLGGMSTSMKAEVNAEADTALTDYDPPTKTEMDTAFTEIKGATWSDTTDTLEHIRNKQTDIETDTAEIGAAGAGLTEAGGTGDHLTAVPEVDANVTKIAGGAVPTPAATGVPDVNVTHIQDGAVPSPAATGVPDVNVTHIQDGAVPAPAATGVPDVNVTHVNDVSAAAANLALACGEMEAGTVSHDNTAATTTVFYSDDITEATADHYVGRLVYFTSGALQKQVTDITAYALDTGEGKFTVTALTEAPADNVTFIIL